MTTDITELAQREKFEAWAEHACAAPWGYLKKRRTTEGYSEQIYTCMWTAWKAAGAELVEALEKAQETIAFQQGEIKALLSSLESRTVTVKLPCSLDFDCEMENGDHDIDEEPYLRGKVDGFNYSLTKVRRLNSAAGIKVEAE
ncbi:TPA: hypothetical protein MFH43_001222 [Klebsiella pneumoniae]|nr:hypothetical protein [Klebsiella pneumoniae]